MRGEKYQRNSEKQKGSGSSPHARGKVVVLNRSLLRLRIIPACAGKSIYMKKKASQNEDHPRMRGEKIIISLQIHGLSGSSPHARGKADTSRPLNSWGRIIPACAGKSNRKEFEMAKEKDHPRMRGEKSFYR